MEPIGKRIRQARKYRKMSQAELARRLKITRQRLNNIEHSPDDVMASLSRLRALAGILKVSGDYLLGLSARMERKRRDCS